MTHTAKLSSIAKLLGLVLLAAASSSPSIWAQQASLASIAGKVVDPQGGALPGVAVKATSPVLQVQQVTATTDAEGNYRLANLPAPGVYQVTFEHAGFQTFVANNLNLPAGGFEGRVDAKMQVGNVVSTVEVSGENPVIDTASPASSETLEKADVLVLPHGGGLQDLYQLAPGVTPSGAPDVGDSNMGFASTLLTNGAYLTPEIKWEGMDTANGGHNFATGTYTSSYEINEVTFQTVGQNADVAKPGFTMDTLVKSGGNAFHGMVLGDYENPAFQGNNVTPALAAQGATVTNPLQLYDDVAGDLGGRIVRDKLWFYTFFSRQEQTLGQISFVSGPDANGCWICADAPPAYSTQVLEQEGGKLNYQQSKNVRWTVAYVHAPKTLTARIAAGQGATTPLPSSYPQLLRLDMGSVGFLWTPSSRWVINVVGGDQDEFAITLPQAGQDLAGHPSSVESSTGLLSGPAEGLVSTPDNRWVLNSSAGYTRGRHNFKFGVDWIPQENRSRVQNYIYKAGNYQLGFTNGKPVSVSTYNYPYNPENGYNMEGLYAMDSWRVWPRLTLNYGVRFERMHDYFNNQQKPAGQFNLAATYPGETASLFEDFVPRVGVAWDIFGKGKTVVKASYGLFADDIGSYFAQSYNPNSLVTSKYKWSGPCVNTGYDNVTYTTPNTSCDIDPTTLATLEPSSPTYIANNPNLQSVTNPFLNQVNHNLKEPKYSIYSARVEQQVVPNVALSAGYIYVRSSNLVDLSGNGKYETVYPNRPYSAYTVPWTFTDSGTGGTGQPITIWSYPATYSAGNCPACNDFMYVNAPVPDTYSTFIVEITKRYSKRWNTTASFWDTKSNRQVLAVPVSPNDVNNVDEKWYWQAHGTLMYDGPWGIKLSSIFEAQNGVYGQRTETFTNNAELLQGGVTRNMEPFGTEQGPVITVTNLKAGKSFKLGESRKLEADWDMYNIFNNSAALSTSYLTGPTFGRITGIVNPRVFRISGRFDF